MAHTAMKLLKGGLIGGSIVVPGVSGGSIAMSMGIYDQLIGFTAAKRKESGRIGRTLLPYGLGVLLGIVGFSYIIEWAMAAYPLATAGVFTGLILGVLPMLIRRVHIARMAPRHLLLLLGTAALLVCMTIFGAGATGRRALAPGVLDAIIAAVLGFVAAATMVVPGVSGSSLLLILGYYHSVIQHVNGFMLALFSLDGGATLAHFAILLPFSLGAVAGIIWVSRAIEGLLRRHPLSAYYAIIGLVLGSPYAVLHEQSFGDPGAFLLLLLAGAAGFVVALFLGRESK